VKRINRDGRLWAPGYPWRPPPRPWVRLGASLGPLGASPMAGGGHVLAFVFLSIVTARGGQTGADHFSSKPRLLHCHIDAPPIRSRAACDLEK
jgi:hypothetical protein